MTTTTTTTTTMPGRPAPSQPLARVGTPALLVRALRSEWVKLRSLRAFYGSVLTTIAVTVGLATLLAWGLSVGPPQEAAQVTTLELASLGIGFGQFGILSLAALAITAEFATGGIRATLAATPARWAVVTAKAITVGAVTAVTGFVSTALALLAVAPILDRSTDGFLASSGRWAGAMVLTSLVTLGLGALLRSTAGTIVSAVALLLAPGIVGGLVTNKVVTTVLDHLPSDLSGVIAVGGEPYGPWISALLLGAWAVALLTAGTFALNRRDS